MLTSPDFKELLKIFNDYKVRYLVVGGYAVMKYTEPRFTKDLDLWIGVDPQNAQAVYKALKKFGAPLTKLEPKDFSQEGYFYQMGKPPLRVDIMMSISGLAFQEAWEKRVEVDLAGFKIPFIAKDDLLRAKEVAARPQDLIDVENLKKNLT